MAGLLAAALVPTGCSESDTTIAAPPAPAGGLPLLGSDCDPMVPTKCGLPFPSSVWLADDATTPTGKRVAFGATTLPPTPQGEPTNPDGFGDADGFSTGNALLTHLPEATVAGLPTQDSLALSVTPDSPTILLDVEEKRLVAHFAELDMSARRDEERAFMIRPVERPRSGARHIVAVRRVVGAGGEVLEPSPVFRALRDGAPSSDPSVVRRRELYADIFARLEAVGVPRADLQIAWDYTTASVENDTRSLLHIRDDALATVGELGPEYVIDDVEEDPNPEIRRRIRGRMTVPLYLDQAGPGAHLVRGADGLPEQNGTAEFEFLVHVPHSATQGTPRPLLQNGHGLLGDKTEGQDDYLAKLANDYGYVAFGVDLVGMAEDDASYIGDTITGDIGAFRTVVDRQHQGIVNSLLAMRMMKGRFWKDAAVTFGGTSAIDPSRCYYRGDSQGGIFGTTYMALSTDVTRGLLGEPGMPFNLMLNRSVDFVPFFALARMLYDSDLDVQLGIGLVQMLWDRTEPNGYVAHLTDDPLPGTPEHRVLLHVAIGDHQVTPLGAHILARAAGAKNLMPVNRSVWGIDEAPGPIDGSAMVEFEFGLPDAPKTNVPPDAPPEEDPHDKVRVLDAAYHQTDRFLREGVVEAFCSGPCDPE